MQFIRRRCDFSTRLDRRAAKSFDGERIADNGARRRLELAEMSGRRTQHNVLHMPPQRQRDTQSAFKAPNRHISMKNRRTNTRNQRYSPRARVFAALVAIHAHLSNYDITGSTIYIYSCAEIPAYVDTKKKEMFPNFVIVQSTEFQTYLVGQISDRESFRIIRHFYSLGWYIQFIPD